MDSSSLEKKSNFSPLKLSLFTSLCVWASDMLFYPIDTVATRIRADHKQHLSFYKGTKMILKNEGIRSLYRGYMTTFSCAFVPTFVYFYCYENLKKISHRYLEQGNHQKAMVFIPVFAGSISEVISLLTYLPFDTVRTRMQANLKLYQYKSITQGIKEIQRTEGIWRLFKASHLYITTSTVYTGIQFQCYEMQRTFLLKSFPRQNNRLEIYEKICVGISASSIAGFLVNPLDFLLTRFQIFDSTKHKLTIKGIVKDVIKNEGISAFYKGLGAKLVFSAMYSMFYLPIYDYFREQYGVESDQ